MFYKFKFRANLKGKWVKGLQKKIQTGPNKLKEHDIKVSNITDKSAILNWSGYNSKIVETCDFGNFGNYQVINNNNRINTSEIEHTVENLQSCEENQMEILPIFEGELGSPVEIR